MDRAKQLVWLFLLWPAFSWGYSGTCGIWAQKRNEFVSRNFSGTQAGYDAAVAFVGTNGSIFVYGGCEGLISLGTLSDSVTVYTYANGSWNIAGNRATAIIPRLGPQSSPTSGGAIRIVDGVTFPTWASAISDLPANGSSVLYPDSSRLWLRGKAAMLLLRDATPGGNGPTDPALYSDKTVPLSTLSNGQADKNVDIVTTYTGTGTATNLSLNGMHVISRFGTGGSGGADVATGMGFGGYAEHRGNGSITGSLYGAELATSMVNTGSLAFGFGALASANISDGANATITTARGLQGLARAWGTGAGSIGTAVGVEGIAGLWDTASANITDAIGGRFYATKAGGASGTISSAFGLSVLATTAGTTNNYGVYIGGASGGSGTNQALRVNSGTAFFGGKVYPDSGLWANASGINFYTSSGNANSGVTSDGSLFIIGGAKLYSGGFLLFDENSFNRRFFQRTTNTAGGIAVRDSANSADLFKIRADGAVVFKSFTLSTLPASPSAGMQVFCSDCTRPSDPASGSGTGGMAIYANSRWYVP